MFKITKDQNIIICLTRKTLRIYKAKINDYTVHTIDCTLCEISRKYINCKDVPCNVNERIDKTGVYFVKVNIFRDMYVKLCKIHMFDLFKYSIPARGQFVKSITKDIKMTKDEKYVRYKPKGLMSKPVYFQFVEQVKKDESLCEINKVTDCAKLHCGCDDRLDGKNGIFVKIK